MKIDSLGSSVQGTITVTNTRSFAKHACVTFWRSPLFVGTTKKKSNQSCTTRFKFMVAVSETFSKEYHREPGGQSGQVLPVTI